jgi:hypothetical protein
MAVGVGPIIESWTTTSPLGIALYDLITDARITEGLTLTARPLGGGKVSTGFQTMSGAYAFRGLDGMRHIEIPAEPPTNSPPPTRDFLITVADARDRFLDTALIVPVPTKGLVTQDVVFGPASLPASPPEADVPLYLFSAAVRTFPSHMAVVRAQLADAASRDPAANAVLEVSVNPLTAAVRRYTGVSDASGAVVVPFPYPRFGTTLGSLASPPAAGTRGQPPADRTWPVEIRARYDQGSQLRFEDVSVPTIQSILAQPSVDVREAAAGPGQPQLSTDLRFGEDLILRSDEDPDSYLLIEPSP